jgi:small subunit ribosomal protein S8
MQSDPLGDFLAALRNASRGSKKEVTVTYSRLKKDVAQVLKEEGFVDSIETVKDKSKAFLKVTVRSTKRVAAINQIKRVSRPGLRRYVGGNEIPRVLAGMGVAILSTSQGVMAGHTAKKRNLGGELLLTVS